MTTFLTVKEAATLTGKSPSSIRRVIYPILHDDNHPDREHIEPTVDEAMALRMKGENFAWRVSEELLRREIPPETVSEKGTGNVSARDHGNEGGELLAMLRRELDIKNHQITVQSELIGKQMALMSELGERLREGNILIGSLQQRLALTDGREVTPPAPVDAKPARAAAPEKTAKQPAPKPTKTKPKRGFLSHLFG